MTVLKQALIETSIQLKSVCDNAYWEAQWLLSHITQLSVTQVHVFSDLKLDEIQQQHLDHLIQRRLKGEPLAYLIGHWQFYGLEFKITPDVLIPRPETETLASAVLEVLPEHGCQVADIGTGSGAIAIALAYHRPQWKIDAIDDSAEALQVAQANVKRHQLANVTVKQGVWCKPLGAVKMDAIVSNPPYIATEDPHFAQASLQYEPRRALDGGEDGLQAIRELIRQAPGHLKPSGWLFLEHGFDQQQAVMALLKQYHFKQTQVWQDLTGQPRVVAGC